VLTDVRFDDAALGDIESVGSLAPGETVSRVIAQNSVTTSYRNVVVVTATGPGGESPSGSDSSEVIVNPVVVAPTPSGSENLPETGATGLIVAVVGAALLFVVGGLALVVGRRRKAA
jgi:LPXTG-motif cell wall-anchored protein